MTGVLSFRAGGHVRLLAWGLGVLGLAGFLVGCELQNIKQCRDQYLKTHAVVSSVDSDDLASVRPALSAVASNLQLCRDADLPEETKQLLQIERKLKSRLAALERRESRSKLTPAELQALKKKGDPKCPRGQSYRYRKSGVQIRCTGPQLVHMNLIQAESYFQQQGFKVKKSADLLFAESGSESYRYRFVSPSSPRADCLTVFGRAGVSWEETAARVTGVQARLLQRDKPVRTKKGPVPLRVEEGTYQAKLLFGDCDQ